MLGPCNPDYERRLNHKGQFVRLLDSVYIHTAKMLSFFLICLLCSRLHLSVGTRSSNEGKIPFQFAYITTKIGDFVPSGSMPIVDWSLEMINMS